MNINEDLDLPKDKKIILFDGVCNLCNHSVLKVIKYDKKNVFLFTALQSEAGKKIVNSLGINTEKIDSIILYDPKGAFYIKASAALRVMNEFGGLWKLTQVFRIVPAVLSNLFYDFVAKNRYRWFGKKESCMIPTTELKSKFLE